jgi:hypothetical protein
MNEEASGSVYLGEGYFLKYRKASLIIQFFCLYLVNANVKIRGKLPRYSSR